MLTKNKVINFQHIMQANMQILLWDLVITPSPVEIFHNILSWRFLIGPTRQGDRLRVVLQKKSKLKAILRIRVLKSVGLHRALLFQGDNVDLYPYIYSNR